MPERFNVEEVFQIAIDIEVNGEKFYRRASELATDDEAKKLLSELADWEEQHIKTFSNMRDSLVQAREEDFTWDPDGEVEMYLQTIADGQVFNFKDDIVKIAEKCRNLTETLEFALAREKDAVIFYTSLEAVVPDKLCGSKLKNITKEEISHVRMLTERIASLSAEA